MIFYDPGKWSFSTICAIDGSVFPRALVVAIPSSAVAVLVNVFFWDESHPDSRVTQSWYAYSFLLSFLVVFRTQQAYSRYWEGASLLHKTKGDWLNAMSGVIAFCSTDPAKAEEVLAFQHLIVRLMSLLHCTALQQVAMMGDESFEIIDLVGIDIDKLQHLTANPENKCLILLQWIQKSIIKGMSSGILPVAPPIMTRVFQQLGSGYTNLIDAQKISDIPFPFPYTQMVTLLLAAASIVTPIVCGMNIESGYWAGGLTFMGIFGFWSINYIAAEIEMPFGDDKNDLPIPQLQIEMNRDLKVLLSSATQFPPSFQFDNEIHEIMNEILCNDGLLTVLRNSQSNKKLDLQARVKKGLARRSMSLKPEQSLTGEEKPLVPANLKVEVLERTAEPKDGQPLPPSTDVKTIGRIHAAEEKSAEPKDDVPLERAQAKSGLPPWSTEALDNRLTKLGARIEGLLIRIASDLERVSAEARLRPEQLLESDDKLLEKSLERPLQIVDDLECL